MSIKTWELSNKELHDLFLAERDVLKLIVRGNTWEPMVRWAKFDSRIFKKKTFTARITLADIESLGEIYGLRLINWEAKKLTPLNTKLVPIGIKNIFRKLPILKSIAYEINISMYKVKKLNKSKSISIVIPARNESGNINLLENAILKLNRLPNLKEIILVEGNSKDNTWDLLKEITNKYCDKIPLLLYKQTGKGKKNAVVEGFDHSNGDVLAIIDSDFTVDLEDSIGAIIQSSKLNNVLINCSRTIFPMEINAMRWANYIGNRLFAILLSNLTNQKISDALCGTKVFSRELFEKMKNNGSWYSKQDPFGDFTILFQASKNHNKILNYPVRYYARKAGSPNISRWIDGLKLLKISIIFWMS